MTAKIRFSVSAIIGFFITATLFIGMLSLLKQSKAMPVGTDANIKFSFVQDYKAPAEEPKPTKTLPEPQKVKQPPAAPSIAVDIDRAPVVALPIDGIGKDTPDLLPGIGMPGLPGAGGVYRENQSGGIKAAIAPMYPPNELMKKTEGWVKLQITVNEFGGVSAVSVIDAQPKRVFNAAATKAIKKWKFHPKMVDGQAVSFIATQTIEFTIDE
ncbi:TonB family protein [Marinicella sp. S1101]|uniref:energy transducer TonB n=1 Tax=Marinicella marina TaxID=2996016 RepID=UPI002260D28E|nr:energy transducer TonB [Marinicella marina]MCX7552298.1 TonB family protein [Marinicella marina]MDJ1139174.1 TonB family protein [Marinicella marina]